MHKVPINFWQMLSPVTLLIVYNSFQDMMQLKRDLPRFMSFPLLTYFTDSPNGFTKFCLRQNDIYFFITNLLRVMQRNRPLYNL